MESSGGFCVNVRYEKIPSKTGVAGGRERKVVYVVNKFILHYVCLSCAYLLFLVLQNVFLCQ